MEIVNLKAYGKINLLLDVTNRRENGYHDIKTIMQSVKLSDDVTIKKLSEDKILLKTNFDDVVKPEDNIAYKAIAMMKEEFSLSCGFDVTINKNIPIAGGMGGGSTNAAAMIKGINELLKLRLSLEEMMELGLRLGADVPFCVFEKSALAYGVGEELTLIEGLKNVKICIVNPKVSVSTKTVYELVDKECDLGKIDENAALECLKKEEREKYPKVLLNIMQDVTRKLCPEIDDIIKGLKELGAVHAMMSGSGPTCFGVFDRDISEEEVKKYFGEFFVAVTEPLV